MAGRGRAAMLLQFKRFYRDENAMILEKRAGKDYFKLFAMFASWLARVADQVGESNATEFGGGMDSKVKNILLAKTLRDWDGWVWVVDRAAEDMVFDTFRPTVLDDDSLNTPLSPTGESNVPPRAREGEEAG